MQRRGFLVSEWCCALGVFVILIGYAPPIHHYAETLQWQQFEKQVRQIQHRAYVREREFQLTSYLCITGHTMSLNNGVPIQLPSGWQVEKNYRFKLSESAPKSGTIHFHKQGQTKKLVFQVGSGTFDVQD